MLTFCSFLRSLSESMKKGFHHASIIIGAIAATLVMSGVAGLLGDGSPSSFAAYAETPMEQEGTQTGEYELLTEAKSPFRLTELSIREEGHKLVGASLAQSIELQQGLIREQQDLIQQQKEAERLAQEEAARQAEAAAKEAAEASAREAQAKAAAIPCSAEDYEVLKRIVQAESGGCDMKGRILIANVIFNRVRSEEFPDSITEVVYQKSQFSPVADGSMKSCKVTDTTIEAVDRALAGEDYSEGALYFMNRKLSRSHNVTWFDRQLTYLFQYDRHEFFK